MARLKPELQHREEPVEPAALMEKAIAAVETTVAADLALNAAVATDLEAAKAKIRAMFGPPEPEPAPPEPETIANGIPLDAIAPPEPVANPIRQDVIQHLVDLQWKHSDAVWVANRTLTLMEEHSISAEYARENAIYEFHRRDPGPAAPVAPAEKSRGARVKEMVAKALQPAEPVSLVFEAVSEGEVTSAIVLGGEPEELTQVVHNLQRDVARLVRLLGMEGARKTRKKKES